MGLYMVTAMGYNKDTLKKLNITPDLMNNGAFRSINVFVHTNLINTETHELFRDCNGPWEIEDRYEHYWNRLRAELETEWFRPYADRVKVLHVQAL